MVQLPLPIPTAKSTIPGGSKTWLQQCLSKRSPTWSIRLASWWLADCHEQIHLGNGNKNKKKKQTSSLNLSKSYVSWTWQRSYLLYLLYPPKILQLSDGHGTCSPFLAIRLKLVDFFTKDFLCFFVKCWGQGSLRACRLYMPHFAKWKKDVESLPATCGSHCGRPKDVQKTNGSCWWPKMAKLMANLEMPKIHRFQASQTPTGFPSEVCLFSITFQGSFLQKDSL